MKLTKFEEYFVSVHKVFNEIGLRHWLVGSSLFGSVREGRIIKGDMEVNFGVMGDELLEKIKDLEKHYKIIYTPSIFKMGGIYLIDKGYEGKLWDHPVGFTYLAVCFKSHKKLIQAILGGRIFYWDYELFDPMGHKEFLGEVFTIPNDPKKWMEAYFGDDWETPDPNWHWNGNAKNLIDIEELL